MRSNDDESKSRDGREDIPPGDMPGEPIRPGDTTWPATPPVFLAPELPKRIGRYVVEGEIGAGGMGRVYAARDEQLARDVAVKVVRSGMTSPASLERFLGESRMLARIEHPGIARVYDCGVDDGLGLPYFVMERVPGGQTLTSFADRVGMSIAERLRLFVRVCEAVQAAHRRGIVHRDLKPSNILVGSAATATSAQPKVIDFGVAEEVRPGEDSCHGGLVGTLEYMSPEQCMGGPVDARSDVYALGVVLYELMSGRLPYRMPGDGLTAESTRVIREDPPVPLGLHRPEFRGDLEAIVLRALEKSPEERYQSASALRRDIRRFLDGQPVEARSRNVAYVAMRRAASAWKRRPWIGVCVATAAAYLVAGTAGDALVYEFTPLDRTYAALLTLMPAAARLGPQCLKTVIVTLPDAEEVQDATASGDIHVSPEGDGWEMPTLENSPASNDKGEIGAFDMYALTVRRLLIAKFLDQMNDVGPSVVALDLYIQDGPPLDDWAKAFTGARAEATAKLAAAAGRLRNSDKKSAVVGGLPTWSNLGDAAKQMSPGIEKSMNWGGLTVSFPPRQVALDLFVDREGQLPIPSLVLEAYALRKGNTTSLPSITVGARRVTLFYQSATEGPTGVPCEPVPPDTIAVSRCDDPVSGDSEELRGIKPKDRVGRYLTELPDDSFFTSATVSMAEAMRMSHEERVRRFGGKAIVIARVDVDLHETDDGRVIPGCWAHTVGLESLLAKKGLIAPDFWESEALVLAGCILGVWVGGARRRWVIALRWAGITLGMAGASLCAYHYAGYQFNPMVPLVSALLAGVLRLALVPRAAGKFLFSSVGIAA